MKRKGFSKFADLTIATGPVTGSHSFIDSAGNRRDVVCADRNCASSSNGNAFSLFYTTAATGTTPPTRWSWIDVGGIAYGANNRYDKILKFDGVSTANIAGMPLGSILELTQDRMAVGDISGFPNRVQYSSAGAYEQFTLGVNPEDSFFDDIGASGDRIRGIKCIQGNCFIFKTQSTTLCQMSDQYNTQCSVISPNIGTTDPASIVAAGPELYFRAQDKNYWKIGQVGLEQISQNIPNLVKSQTGGLGGGENINTQTTQADWQNGYQGYSTGTFNTTTTPGSIFPSSITLVDSSSTSFSGGTFGYISSGTVSSTSAIFMAASTTGTLVWETWTDLVFTGSVTWTKNDSDWGIHQIDISQVPPVTAGVYLACRSEGSQSDATEANAIFTTGAAPTGVWEIALFTRNLNGGAFTTLLFEFIRQDSNNALWLQIDKNGLGTHSVALKQKIGGATQTLGQTYAWSSPDGNISTFTVVRDTNAYTSVFIKKPLIASSQIIGSTTSNAFFPLQSSVYIAANGDDPSSNCSAPGVGISSVSIPFYPSTATFYSRVFDTAFTTATGGTFSVSSVTPPGTTLTFQTRSSANGATGWTTWSNITNLDRIVEQNRYVQYLSSFTTTVSSQTAYISTAALVVATTGQFVTQCIQPNASISAWGTLSCATTLTGNASLVFYATSAVSCASLPVSTPPVNGFGANQAGWITQTNNATITASTNTALFIGFRSLLTSATEQAQVDSCITAWTEGTPAQAAWGVYDSIKNAIYWTTTINGASYSNRLLKYDRNLGEWYPFDIRAQAPKVINNTLYFGGASSGTWNSFGTADSDAGNPITAYWTGKDVGSDRPFQGKSFKTISILAKNNGAGNLTGTWTLSNAQTGSYTASLSTGAGIIYARSNYNLPFSSPQQFMRLKVGNTTSTPFEVLGIGINWQVQPWRVEGP